MADIQYLSGLVDNESLPAFMRESIADAVKEIESLREDKTRLDWLADPKNGIGNVQLPTLCVVNNPGDMRAAIDDAIRIDQDKWADVGDAYDGAEMKEDTLEYQLAHCGGKDCTCAARGESECACDADWTPAEVCLLRHQEDAMRKDAERYRFLERGGLLDLPYDDHGIGPEYDLSRAAIDAAMRANA